MKTSCTIPNTPVPGHRGPVDDRRAVVGGQPVQRRAPGDTPSRSRTTPDHVTDEATDVATKGVDAPDGTLVPAAFVAVTVQL